MSFILEIIDGPEKGRKITIQPGDTFGRVQGTHLLNDPKVSALHAEVAVNEKGQLLLIDKDSSNGIKFKNVRVPQIILAQGTQFILGKNTFRFSDTQADLAKPAFTTDKKASTTNPRELEKKAVNLKITTPHQEGAESPRIVREEEKVELKPAPKNEKLLPWDHYLKKTIPRLNISNATEPSHIRAFQQPLILAFTQGPDTEKELVLGYGPRSIGFQCLDLELSDPSLPDLCFTIGPDEQGEPILTTSDKMKIKLNGSVVSSEKLNHKDVIEFGTNKIEVRIHNEK